MYNLCVAGCWLLGLTRSQAIEIKENTDEICYLVKAS